MSQNLFRKWIWRSLFSTQHDFVLLPHQHVAEKKLTDASLLSSPRRLFVCRGWRRRTNAWNWSCLEPRWRWPRLRWRRTRCYTGWRTWKSTPARPGCLFSVKLSQPTAHLHPSGPEVEARLCHGRQNGDFANKASPSTCTLIERATTWLYNSK